MISRLLKAAIGGIIAFILTTLIIRIMDDAPMRVVSRLIKAEEDLSDDEAEAILRELASMA
jgi:hypothetical protein